MSCCGDNNQVNTNGGGCCDTKPSSCCNGDDSKIEAGKELDSVKEYYGKILQKSEDLKTNACCTGEAPADHLKAALRNVHDEVLAKYYGCGLVLPDQLKGMKILDLGCGAGRDVYVLAQFVGEEGFVMGVDMTDEQLEVANRHKEYHREKFGYKNGNVEFRKGYIEKLADLEIEDNTFDLIVSNCVINLSPDKEAVLSEAFRILKPGGELYFSDVYASQRVPKHLREDPVLWGECLSGALYWNDFINISAKCGFPDARLVCDSPITIENKKVEEKIGHIDFYSATYRLFKLKELEPDCEDYGQAVIYKGTIDRCPNSFILDAHHEIKTGKVFPVCGNTFNILKLSRFSSHFEFIGDFSNHYGIFDGCGKGIPFSSSKKLAKTTTGGGCC